MRKFIEKLNTVSLRGPKGRSNLLKDCFTSFAMTLIFLLFTISAVAEDISFDAQVDTNQTTLGSAIQLTLKINGTQDVSPITLPKMDGFDARYLGPSTRVSIVNGQTSSSIAFNYTLFSLKVGKFQIPAIDVDIKGKKYTSAPIDVEVSDSSQQIPTPNSPTADQTNPTISLKDKLFLVLKTSKSDVYINEPLPVKILLFVSSINVSDIHFPELDKDGFNLDEFQKPRQYQQTINGIGYDIVEFDTTLYPTKTGQIKIGPAKLECNVVYKTAQGQRGSFFKRSITTIFSKKAPAIGPDCRIRASGYLSK